MVKALSGIVTASESEIRGDKRGITTIKLDSEDNEEFKITGQHRIDVGEKIIIGYNPQLGINQVVRYSIYDRQRGTVLYACNILPNR
jgi:hypothetical protein